MAALRRMCISGSGGSSTHVRSVAGWHQTRRLHHPWTASPSPPRSHEEVGGVKRQHALQHLWVEEGARHEQHGANHQAQQAGGGALARKPRGVCKAVAQRGPHNHQRHHQRCKEGGVAGEGGHPASAGARSLTGGGSGWERSRRLGCAAPIPHLC